MSLRSVFSFIVLATILGCESMDIAPGAPTCLKELIRSKPQPKQISSYLFNGKKVYLVFPDCCDQYISLYDENCNYLCAPSGGFTERGDGKCPDFNDKATYEALVWKRE